MWGADIGGGIITGGGYGDGEFFKSAVLKRVEGAYAFVLMSKDEMVAARDPQGFRPLSIGRIGDGYVK